VRLYNVDHLPAVVDNNAPAVKPGDAHDFTDEQARRLTGLWSKEDPRKGVGSKPTGSKPTSSEA
jgi:hypothetical protein